MTGLTDCTIKLFVRPWRILFSIATKVRNVLQFSLVQSRVIHVACTDIVVVGGSIRLRPEGNAFRETYNKH